MATAYNYCLPNKIGTANELDLSHSTVPRSLVQYPQFGGHSLSASSGPPTLLLHSVARIALE